jgi:hypothetical protein
LDQVGSDCTDTCLSFGSPRQTGQHSSALRGVAGPVAAVGPFSGFGRMALMRCSASSYSGNGFQSFDVLGGVRLRRGRAGGTGQMVGG